MLLSIRPNVFRNKVAIVTGASSGIGRATALALASHGAFVALIARRHEPLVDVMEEITSQGSQAIVIPADVTQNDQVEKMVQIVLNKWGRIDILVSNAGAYIRSPIIKLDHTLIQKSLDINFFGGINCILAVLPHMLTQDTGHIIVITSMDGKIGLPMDAPYVSAKFALTGFSEVLRQELRESGVCVTNILPGRVNTPMIKDLEFPLISKKIPPEKVAQSVLNAIRRKKTISIVPLQAIFLYYLNVFSPSLSDWITKSFRLEGWEIDQS